MTSSLWLLRIVLLQPSVVPHGLNASSSDSSGFGHQSACELSCCRTL